MHLHSIFQNLEISNRAALAISHNNRSGPPEDKPARSTCLD
jgi:hypothetical protein